MRRTASSAVALALAACGGGGDDATNPDAATSDGAPTGDGGFTCGLAPTYELRIPATGAATLPWARVNDHDAVLVNGILTEAAPNKSITIIMVSDLGMFAPSGALGPLSGPPAADVQAPLDSGATCGGCLEGYTGWTDDIEQADQIYVVDLENPGSLTFTTSSGEGAPGETMLEGSYIGVNLIGLDAATEEPNGCHSSVDFEFHLNMTPPPATLVGRQEATSVGVVGVGRRD
jgi:hypothetical protein